MGFDFGINQKNEISDGKIFFSDFCTGNKSHNYRLMKEVFEGFSFDSFSKEQL